MPYPTNKTKQDLKKGSIKCTPYRFIIVNTVAWLAGGHANWTNK